MVTSCFLFLFFSSQTSPHLKQHAFDSTLDFGRPLFTNAKLLASVHSFLINLPLSKPSLPVSEQPPKTVKMRFAVVAALFAGAVLAHDKEPESTLYTTKYYTITACPSTVTDCPAKVTSSVIPLTTSTVYTTKLYTVTSCAETVTNCPAHSTVVVTATEAVSTTVCPVEQSTKYYNTTTPKTTSSWSVPYSVSSKAPITTTTPPVCPTYSVKTISTSYTTVIPTVVYETVSIPCPTPSKPSASYSANATVPTKPVTAGAGSYGASVLFAAAAGVAALVLA
jgi:hypothetical protein